MKEACSRGFVLFLLGLCMSVPMFSQAQESCGNFLYGTGEDQHVSPIESCENPFGIIGYNPNLEVSFGGTHIEEGEEHPFLNVQGMFEATQTHPDAFSVGFELYKHAGNDYLQIELNNPIHTFTEVSTYTLVVYEDGEPILSKSLFHRFLSFLIPPAYAFPGPSRAITFDVIAVEEETTGISNILFLPGIQASRLYVDDNGSEEKLWEPFGDDEVEMLRMTDGGESIHDVYTKDIVDELPNGANIYKGFIQHLVDLDDADGGPLVTTFPYDWRHDVFDIVDNGTKIEDGSIVRPTDVIETSASVSPTGRVTLIAHSNGGLLAKAIMLKLEEEGTANLVDKVILVASPHIGTPKGLAALLHGYDQENLNGLISSDEKVRSVMKNMQGVYGLLPSESYLSSLTEPLISFDDSDTTSMYRNAYGFTISNMGEYVDFLKGTEGRGDAEDEVNKIGTTNEEMLESALAQHRELLDSWSAPEGIEVFNIVGTGLPTPKSIEYREFEDCSTVVFGVCVAVKSKLEPVLHFTRYGDQTVVSKSAGFSDTVKYYIDLFSISEFIHADITESETTQTLIDHILHGSSTEGINFVSNTEPSFNNDGLDIFTIHSPARIYLRDSGGNITGRTEVNGDWKSEIQGSDYFEAGGVKYVLAPSNGEYTVVVEGEGSGVYTHSLTMLTNEIEEIHHTYTASVTPTSVIQYTKSNDTFSTISVDEDGDGVTDTEMTLEGEIIEKEITYDDLESAVRALKLPRKYERPLLVLVEQAEKLSHHHSKKHKKRHAEDVLLRVIEKQLGWYQKIWLITKVQYKEVDGIINKLIEK